MSIQKPDTDLNPALPTSDLLVQRYHEASDRENAQPSARVRANVLAAARQQAEKNQQQRTAAAVPVTTTRSAANDRQWLWRAAASLAVISFAGLLTYQFMLPAIEQSESGDALSPPVPVIAAAPAPVTRSAAQESAAVVPEAASANADLTSAATEPKRQATAPSAAADHAQKRTAVASAPPAVSSPNAPKLAAPPTPMGARSEAAVTHVAPPPAATASSSVDAADFARAPIATAAPAPPAPATAAGPTLRKAQPMTERATANTETEAAGTPAAPAPRVGDMTANMQRGMNQVRLLSALRSNDLNALRTALQNGADVNTKDRGTPILTLAAQSGQTAMVKALLMAGAIVNAQDTAGHTALFYAQQNGHNEVAEALRSAGAEP